MEVDHCEMVPTERCKGKTVGSRQENVTYLTDPEVPRQKCTEQEFEHCQDMPREKCIGQLTHEEKL